MTSRGGRLRLGLDRCTPPSARWRVRRGADLGRPADAAAVGHRGSGTSRSAAEPGRQIVAEFAAPIMGRDKDELIGKHLAERRRTRRLVVAVIAVMAVLVVLAGVGALVARDQRDEAIRQRAAANTQARLAISRALAAASEDQAQSSRDLSLLLAVERLQVEPHPPSPRQPPRRAHRAAVRRRVPPGRECQGHLRERGRRRGHRVLRARQRRRDEVGPHGVSAGSPAGVHGPRECPRPGSRRRRLSAGCGRRRPRARRHQSARTRGAESARAGAERRAGLQSRWRGAHQHGLSLNGQQLFPRAGEGVGP